MLTEGKRQTYGRAPTDDKAIFLALSVLMGRIEKLPEADRNDLYELLQAWPKADDPEEVDSIQRAMEEILSQEPVTVRRLPLADAEPMPRRLKNWARHVGRKIRELRDQAGLTQVELAKKAGLPQSHISRLENAEHSATHLTLEKIAGALGVPVGALDPCVE